MGVRVGKRPGPAENQASRGREHPRLAFAPGPPSLDSHSSLRRIRSEWTMDEANPVGNSPRPPARVAGSRRFRGGRHRVVGRSPRRTAGHDQRSPIPTLQEGPPNVKKGLTMRFGIWRGAARLAALALTTAIAIGGIATTPAMVRAGLICHTIPREVAAVDVNTGGPYSRLLSPMAVTPRIPRERSPKGSGWSTAA